MREEMAEQARASHYRENKKSLAPANQAAPREVVLDTCGASLESLQLALRLFVSSMTNLMHGVARVVGQHALNQVS